MKAYRKSEIEKLGAVQLRKLVRDAANYKGRTAEIRKLSKADHIFMLSYGIELNKALNLKNHADINGLSGVEEAHDRIYGAPEMLDELHSIEQEEEKKEETQESPAQEERVEYVSDDDLKAGNGKAPSTLEDVIASAVLQRIDLKSILNKDTINRAIHDKVLSEIEDVRRVKIEVETPKGTIPAGIQHEEFETLLNLVALRENVMLVGPAGSGKTYSASVVAKSLDIPFYSMSVGQQTSKVDFMGYTDAHGNYVRTLWREAFENGGVFLIDEIDSGNANIITIINAATANHQAGFPDGMVQKHEDFVVIAAANTFGNGASRQYVGRSQLDAATLDRFCTLEWYYDEKLEEEIAGDRRWTRKVQKIRKIVMEKGIRHVVSPRASIKGAKMLAAGMDERKVEKMVIWKGMSREERKMIEEAI